MVRHHPDEQFLTDYAAGGLDWGIALVVAAHLQFCPICKHKVAKLNKVGGDLLATAQPNAPAAESFPQLMARIREAQPQPAAPVEETMAGAKPWHKELPWASLPIVVKKLLPQDKHLKWRFVNPHLKKARLASGQRDYEVALHRVAAGGAASRHNHRGLEITLVLQGSFSDQEGLYQQGDFLVRGPGQVHAPTATQNEDCLCLTLTEAPMVLTGFWGRLLNPVLSIKPG